jgi:hypothetical protein
MSSCGHLLMGGNCNGTVKQCKVKEQSIYRPQYVLCDKQFVTYIRTYNATCFDTEALFSGTHHRKCI